MHELVVDALAVSRLRRLVGEDIITRRLREALPLEGEEFVTCPACVSVWLAAGVVAARRLAPRSWALVGGALALSEAAILLGARRANPTGGYLDVVKEYAG